MKDEGQIILLSAVIACVFLVLIALCLESVRGSAAISTDTCLSRDEANNVLRAQDACLRWSAEATAGYSWDRRYEAVNAFRTGSAPALESMTRNLQRRGIAYTFTYNDSAARPYVDRASPGDAECIGGIIVSRDGSGVKIIGCGYDVGLFEGSAGYEITRLEVW